MRFGASRWKAFRKPRGSCDLRSMGGPPECDVNGRCWSSCARRGFLVRGRSARSMPSPADWPRGPVSGRDGGVAGPCEGCAVRGRDTAPSDSPPSIACPRTSPRLRDASGHGCSGCLPLSLTARIPRRGTPSISAFEGELRAFGRAIYKNNKVQMRTTSLITMNAIASTAEFICSEKCKSIAFLTGAGCRFALTDHLLGCISWA
jgi:hypothetical protein